jgi:outer membrane protein TolC
VELAQRNNPAVQTAGTNVSRALAAYSERKDVVIPSVLFSTGLPALPGVGFTGTPPSIWSAAVNSQVFSIPQRRYIDAARLELQAATTNLKDAREQVALDASTAYVELDTVRQEQSAAKREEGFANRLVGIEQERAEAGVDRLRDVLEAKLIAAEIKLKGVHLAARAATLAERLAALTGLPPGSITPDHSGIPEIPEICACNSPRKPAGVESLRVLAQAKQQLARGDKEINYLPQLSFGLQYNRNTTILNSANDYFVNPHGGTGLPENNVSSRVEFTVPIFDLMQRAKARESTAEALHATVEAQQAERQNDIAIAELTSRLRELATRAEIASLQQQIAQQNLIAVVTRLETGNGTGGGRDAMSQLSPKAEQLARIDQEAKLEDSLETCFDLAKARLSLLRALGHMEDWLHELK